MAMRTEDRPLSELVSEVTGELAALMEEPAQETALVPVGGDLYAVRLPETRTWAPVTFYALPTGEPYVHFGVRATPKVA